MKKLLIFHIFSIYLFCKIKSRKCNIREIQHCKKCGTGDLSDSCAECEDKYFPLYSNISCIKCNDEEFGQVGCIGKCDGSNYINSRNVLCEENGCKEGYYNVDGFCFNCTNGSEHCIKCSYIAPYQSNIKRFQCNECEGGLYGIYRVSDIDGTCTTCKIQNCIECHYINGSNDSVCDVCKKGYYVNSTGGCSECKYINNIANGVCYHCPVKGVLNSDKQNCSCYSYYTLKDPYSCIKCPSNCYYCTYNNVSSLTYCKENGCDYGYTFDKGNCAYCGNNCGYCYLNTTNNNPYCTSCKSGYRAVNGKCYKCPPNCATCINSNYNSNELICSSCKNYYTLISNNTCTRCPYQCTTCHFDNNNRPICDTCYSYSYNYVMNKSNLCEICSANEEIGGKGCTKCEYLSYYKQNRCYKCTSDYIFIKNDYVCRLPTNARLHEYCANATNAGNITNPKYFCVDCKSESYVRINNSLGMSDCYPQEDNLVNCLQANEDELGNRQCTKCIYNYPLIWSDYYNQTICDNKCALGFFFRNKDKWCYECDNISYGNPGCNASFGCNYTSSNNELDCYDCKKGYFLYKWQCLKCSNPFNDTRCIQCHFDLKNEKFQCDQCIEGYYFNNKTSVCEIITYDEYPDVTPGCILSINNYTLYKDKKKCLLCKPGFIKTKDESCIYCKARKNGGPKCEECEYIKDSDGNTTDEIKCKRCPTTELNLNGKCYKCEDEAGLGCSKCKFEGERVICEKCKDNYELNSDGYCINIQRHFNNIPHCSNYNYTIYNNKRRLFSSIKTSCLICKDGYYKDDEDKCISLSLEKCSLLSIFEFSKSIYDECKRFCNVFNYALVDYKDKEEKISEILKYKNINFDSLEDDIKNIIQKGKLCVNNTGKNNILRKCQKVEYNEANNNYICIKCIGGYKLSENRCIQNTEIEEEQNPEEINCELEENTDKFSCKRCNNESDILIKAEYGNYCKSPVNELDSCLEVIANTDYLKTQYNCTQCTYKYISYYNEFYNRLMCLGAFDSIERAKELPSDAYIGVENDTNITDGKCKIDNAFSPDGKHCFKCYNKLVGMAGCSGSCTYSTKRNNIILCEGGCSSGYIEVSKGVCEPCSEVNNGCKSCSYTTKYYEGYNGFNRKRRFICDDCQDGYLLLKDGICHHCTEFGFKNCDRCHEENNEFECVKCIDGYFLTNNGYCAKCEEPKVQGINNVCTFCNDTDEGGIEGCEQCFSDDGKIICQQCKQGFILLENNQSCIKIYENSEFENFINCQRITFDENGKYYCSKCFDNYILLKDNNGERCVNNNFIITPKPGLLNYCKDSINIGTEDKPRHSCNKCIVNDILTQEQREKGITITKITYSENSTSFCNISEGYNILENCSEALRKIDNEGNEIFTCNKCEKENKFIYVADRNLTICQYIKYDKKCMVKDCKTCKNGNNYFCSKCLLDNYEVNPASGSCVKKTEKPPIITWKDIFRFELNSKLIVNGQTIYGPSLMIRGISNDQINPGHAFLILLTFSVKYTRNLEEGEQNLNEDTILNVPTLCQAVDNYDETKNEINIVDYQCIGNRTGEDQFKENEVSLKNIEENNTVSDYLSKTNFEEMVANVDLDIITNKTTSSFTLSMASEIVTFEMEDIVNQKSNNYIYDFTIYGKINKDLKKQTIKGKIKFVEIKNATGDCEINIREKRNADIKCYINLEKYPENKVVSIKTMEIQNKENTIYLSKFNDIKLIHEDEEKEEEKRKTDFIKIALIILAIVLVIVIILVVFFIKKALSKKIITRDITSSENQKYNEKNGEFKSKDIFTQSTTTKRAYPSVNK